MTIKRDFACIDLRQVHYYTAGYVFAGNGKNLAILNHASPFAARAQPADQSAGARVLPWRRASAAEAIPARLIKWTQYCAHHWRVG